MKIITVANQKGGVGKTTTAINIAALLGYQGYKVLTIDLDPQASMTKFLRIKPGNNHLLQVFSANETRREILIKEALISTRYPNLSIIPASLKLSTQDIVLTKKGAGLFLKKSLSALIDEFDYVIIDCSPTLNVFMVNAIACSDLMIIPTQTEHLSLFGLDDMLKTIKMITHSLKNKIPYLIVPTMHHIEQLQSQFSLKKIHQKYENVSNVVIPYDPKMVEAVRAQEPIFIYSPKSEAAKQYTQLTHIILDTIQELNKQEAEKHE